MARPSREGVTVEVDLGKQTGHSPLWNGARRASMDVPGAPVDGLWTPRHVQRDLESDRQLRCSRNY
jgi:hypothetical protein